MSAKPVQTQKSETEEEGGGGEGGVKLERSLSLFNGISIIVGCIIGSGIFVSPKGVHEKAGSVGFSLVVWVVCGIFSAMGAYCYAELGTLIRKTGGDYAYISEAFGGFVGFIRLWIEAMIVRPCSCTIVCLTFAVYMLRPLFPHCPPPPGSTELLAAFLIATLTLINCWSVRAATAVQDFFTVAKLFALALIIITGIVNLGMGRTKNFDNLWEGTNPDIGDASLAFYAGLFAYNGWNYLNFVVEELKNPKRNLPLAIAISIGIVTVVYTFTNVAFYTVISPDEMLESPAVAVEFARKLYGVMAFTMPLFVACSTIGSANGVILTSSRLFYAGGREGHMPQILTMISATRLTPIPAVLLTGGLSILFLALSSNIFALINYIQISYWLAIGVAMLALFWLRRTMPDAARPIKVPLVFPILFFLGCVFLVVVPIYSAPVDTAIGLGIMLTSVPVYLVFVAWKNKPRCFDDAVDAMTRNLQKTLLVVGEDAGKSD